MRTRDALGWHLTTDPSLQGAQLPRADSYSSHSGCGKHHWHTFPRQQSRSGRLVHNPEPSKDGLDLRTAERVIATTSRLEPVCLVQACLTSLIILGPKNRGPQATPVSPSEPRLSQRSRAAYPDDQLSRNPKLIAFFETSKRFQTSHGSGAISPSGRSPPRGYCRHRSPSSPRSSSSRPPTQGKYTDTRRPRPVRSVRARATATSCS